MIHEHDLDLGNIEYTQEKIDEIEKTLKKNENLNPQSNFFSNFDNTPKKTSLKRVQIDDSISKKDFFKIYNTTNIKPYYPYSVYIDKKNFKKLMEYIEKIEENQIDGIDNLILSLSLNNFDNGYILILYLTKTQIKTLRDIPRIKYFDKNNKVYFKNLKFSKTQMLKTFPEVFEINHQFNIDKLSKLKKSFKKSV